jgi:hypothetical protein
MCSVLFLSRDTTYTCTEYCHVLGFYSHETYVYYSEGFFILFFHSQESLLSGTGALLLVEMFNLTFR